MVYVLNAGSDNIQGFRLGIYGKLTPIAGSKRALSGTGTAAAQVEFNRDGDLLAVTEKATNRVLTFTVDGDGRLSQATIQASPSPTPFGFAFGRRDQLLSLLRSRLEASGVSPFDVEEFIGTSDDEPERYRRPSASGQPAAFEEASRDD